MPLPRLSPDIRAFFDLPPVDRTGQLERTWRRTIDALARLIDIEQEKYDIDKAMEEWRRTGTRRAPLAKFSMENYIAAWHQSYAQMDGHPLQPRLREQLQRWWKLLTRNNTAITYVTKQLALRLPKEPALLADALSTFPDPFEVLVKTGDAYTGSADKRLDVLTVALPVFEKRPGAFVFDTEPDGTPVFQVNYLANRNMNTLAQFIVQAYSPLKDIGQALVVLPSYLSFIDDTAYLAAVKDTLYGSPRCELPDSLTDSGFSLI